MYRAPAAEPEVELFRARTGISTTIIVLLAGGPLFLVLVGFLTNAVLTMLVAALPFWVVAGLLAASRRTTIVGTRTLRSSNLISSRELVLGDAVRLIAPNAIGQITAATSGSRNAAAVLVWDATSSSPFIVPGATPIEVVRSVVAAALPPALARAEAALAAGGRYTDGDNFSGLEGSTLWGHYVGFATSKRTVDLTQISRVNAGGQVEHPGEPFMIGLGDLVLHGLLVKRGVNVETPYVVARLQDQA